MKKNKDSKSNGIKKASSTLMILTVIYILMVIMSVIGRVSTLEHTSTTEVTFSVIMKEFVNPVIIIAMLVVTIILYNKKESYAIILEYIIAISTLINILISVVSIGFNILALILSLMFPLMLILHSTVALVKKRLAK